MMFHDIVINVYIAFCSNDVNLNKNCCKKSTILPNFLAHGRGNSLPHPPFLSPIFMHSTYFGFKLMKAVTQLVELKGGNLVE